MKKSQTRGQRLVWLCGLAFIVAGCDNPTNPTSPSAVPAPGVGIIAPLGVGAGPQTASTPIAVGAGPQTASALRGARPGKYTMCHVTASGTYVPIKVSESAMAAHQAHGDWRPEDGSCSLSGTPTDPPPVKLSCGAPTEATNPGSTFPPGPTVDTTTAGVNLEFAVTASPAPTSLTWIVQEVLDEYLTGPVPPQTTSVPLKADGTYEGSSWTSGAVSFVREIRFTLDAASCSLFWNINPPSGS